MFLANYFKYASGDEAPENYHIWAGISVLASIISRKVWLPIERHDRPGMAKFRIYPNLYLIFLGPPGNGKTTAMDRAKDLVRDLEEIPFSAERAIKEGIIEDMEQNCQRNFIYNGKPILYTPYTVFVTELSHFIGFDQAAMLDFLTTIYDRNIYDYKKRGTHEVIHGPCLNLLACTTQEWITSYLKADIISGGFSRRVIYVNEHESPKFIPFPETTEAQRIAKEECIKEGKVLLKLKGPMQWTKEAETTYCDWYVNRELPKDPNVRGFYKTKHIQILKVAILMACSNHPDDLRLRHEDFIMAGDAIAKLEERLPSVFRSIGRNELNLISQRVLDYVDASGGAMLEKDLRIMTYKDCNTQEYQSVMQHLTVSSEELHYVTIRWPADSKIERRVVVNSKMREKLIASGQLKTLPAGSGLGTTPKFGQPNGSVSIPVGSAGSGNRDSSAGLTLDDTDYSQRP